MLVIRIVHIGFHNIIIISIVPPWQGEIVLCGGILYFPPPEQCFVNGPFQTMSVLTCTYIFYAAGL